MEREEDRGTGPPTDSNSLLHHGFLMEASAWSGMKNLSVPRREDDSFTCWSVLQTPQVVIYLELELILCTFQRDSMDNRR